MSEIILYNFEKLCGYKFSLELCRGTCKKISKTNNWGKR